ncbi:MAG: hypothetical protein ACT4N2_06620 [Hyphomicrobium sp.]
MVDALRPFVLATITVLLAWPAFAQQETPRDRFVAVTIDELDSMRKFNGIKPYLARQGTNVRVMGLLDEKTPAQAFRLEIESCTEHCLTAIVVNDGNSKVLVAIVELTALSTRSDVFMRLCDSCEQFLPFIFSGPSGYCCAVSIVGGNLIISGKFANK